MRILFLMILITIVGCETTSNNLASEIKNQYRHTELPIDLSGLVLKDGVYYDVGNNQPFSGKVISKGKYITGVGQLLDGLRDGLWKKHWSNMTPEKKYFKDGFHLHVEYKKGKSHGRSIWYTYDGRIETFESYKNGKQNGVSYSYFSNRQLKYRFEHKDDLEHGKQTAYYENGQLEYTYNTIEGKVTDYFYDAFYSSGQLKRKTHYKDGESHGKSASYYPNGNLEVNKNYKNGKLDGRRTSYYENGTIKSLGEYKTGKIHGEHASYREDGSLEFRSVYKNGERTELKGYNFEGDLETGVR